jgi:hypothetical protein
MPDAALEASVLDLKFAAFAGHALSELQIQKSTVENMDLLVSSSIPKFANCSRKRLRTSESGH